MINLSIDSFSYIGLLIIAPFILHFTRKKSLTLYTHVFLGINLLIYIMTLQSIIQTIVFAIWIFLPFIYLKFIKRKYPLIILLVIGFIYLNQYDWIIVSLGIPYVFLFKIFGLSYILFRQIDYILQYDINKEIAKRTTLVKYLNYLLSFYTIISGPIQRYSEFLDSFENPKEPLAQKELLSTFNRILNGYLKIFVFSYFCNKIASDNFEIIGQSFNFFSFIIFAFANVAYIYFNFSGYCDVVIGFAKIAGIILPENFNKPYIAQDINDFWGRQHITLTKWITDYIFNPFVKFLSSKGLNFRTAMYISFFVAFLFAGIWHGSTINYVIYGVLQAIGVCLTQLYLMILKKKYKTKKAIRIHREKLSVKIVEIAVTQLYIAMTFIFIGYDIISLIL